MAGGGRRESLLLTEFPPLSSDAQLMVAPQGLAIIIGSKPNLSFLEATEWNVSQPRRGDGPLRSRERQIQKGNNYVVLYVGLLTGRTAGWGVWILWCRGSRDHHRQSAVRHISGALHRVAH